MYELEAIFSELNITLVDFEVRQMSTLSITPGILITKAEAVQQLY